MGKQKYPQASSGEIADGENKQRNHRKSGKLAKRRELRRLEATARQVERVKKFEKALEKAKKKGPAQAKLTQAQLTLQKIRGGVPHSVLDHKFKTATEKEANEQVESKAVRS